MIKKGEEVVPLRPKNLITLHTSFQAFALI